jgi:hypothetical protein
VTTIWERALAAGAPAQAVAHVSYTAASTPSFYQHHGEPPLYDVDQPVAGVWTLRVSDGTKTLFSHDFDDDCDGAPPAVPRPAAPAYRDALAKLLPGGPVASLWVCPLRAGADRVHVRAHLEIPVGGMSARAKVLEAKAAPHGLSSAKQAALVTCLEDGLARLSFPAPGAVTETDVEIDVSH